jgi:hypothetical protein
VNINKTWETIREDIRFSARKSLGYYELKQHKPWFDEGCSELLDQWKQGKLQWLQDQNQINGYDNVKHEASRNIRNKKREYLKDIINDLATNSKNKNSRDLCSVIDEFKKGYQTRITLEKDENGDLLADSVE